MNSPVSHAPPAPSILLIESSTDRACATANAMASAGMRVTTAESLSSARHAMQSEPAFDFVVAWHTLPDGSIFELTPCPVPMILCTEPGQQVLATQAMRQGIIAHVVCDPAQAHAPLIVAQVETLQRALHKNQQLRQSGNIHWRDLVELSSDWSWEQDKDFRLVRMESTARSKTGLDPQELLGRRHWELPTLNVSHAQWQAHRAMLEAHEVFHNFEMQIIDMNGDVHWTSVSGVPIFDDQGAFMGYQGVGHDITHFKRAEERIEWLAFNDDLTGLPNRNLLLDRLERALASCARHRQYGAVLFLDLDNFKDLNDTQGHDKGDQLLQQVAKRLVGCVRGRDTVARFGGDEFVIILEELGHDLAVAMNHTRMVAQKILAGITRPYMLAGHEYRCTPSVGITMFSSPQQPVATLLKQADLAMYQAKAAGRNTLFFFDPQMSSDISEF